MENQHLESYKKALSPSMDAASIRRQICGTDCVDAQLTSFAVECSANPLCGRIGKVFAYFWQSTSVAGQAGGCGCPLSRYPAADYPSARTRSIWVKTIQSRMPGRFQPLCIPWPSTNLSFDSRNSFIWTQHACQLASWLCGSAMLYILRLFAAC